MELKEKLTLILLVHDNTSMPKRWIKYASYIKLPYKILIADGGASNIFKDFIQQNSQKLNLDIEYFKYKHEKEFSDFYYKSNDILKKVKTQYVCMCSDDDFLLPTGVQKTIEFLDNHKEYSSARGEMLGIKFENNKNHKYIYGSDFKIFTSSQVSSSLNFEDLQIRLWHQLKNYQLTYYDIHRTDHLQFAYEKLTLKNPTAYILHEIVTSGFTVLKGKVFRGNYPYLIKDHGPTGITANEKKIKFYLDWLTKTKWGFEFNLIIESFIKYIKDNGYVIDKKYDLHFAHLKFLRKNLVSNFYKNDPLIIRVFIYLISRIEMIYNFKTLYQKIILVLRQKFSAIVVKEKIIIKNKKKAETNDDFNKLILFLKEKIN
mgnify:CR=1 FL=1